MKNAIDLYSGIGGWTLGMKLSGVNSISSYEWWSEANKTHNLNFNTSHKEIDIRGIDVKEDLKFKSKIDFVVGSPPCTQFSLANRGGSGNIQDGLVDVYKFLEVVEYLKPKYWAMENVPRVAKILEKELNSGVLKRFKKLVKVIEVVDSSDYGVPQSRKRMIAGDFPIELFNSYKTKISKKSLKDVIRSLNSNIVTDPNYGYKIERRSVTELENEPDLTLAEERINRDAKVNHPIYNKMSFPDNMEKPSRTITATCTRISRESIIIKSSTGFRRLNVRERATIQAFPITYQFAGKSVTSKFKMIGNAVPPMLTYYIFQSMLEVNVKNLKFPDQSNYHHVSPLSDEVSNVAKVSPRIYSSDRKFQFVVPNLRFGSGVRFELSNTTKKGNLNKWTFKFIYGNSKSIKEIVLNAKLSNSIETKLTKADKKIFDKCLNGFYKIHGKINSKELQAKWIDSNSEYSIFKLLDDIGVTIETINNLVSFKGINTDDFVEEVIEENNKKIKNVSKLILIGFYFLSKINETAI